ncbi:MAG: LppX_LprAFG lipoprotein, partial [Actinomycetota bacterium]
MTAWLAVALSLLAVASMAACNSVPANLPAASGVLQDAVQAMDGVSSTAFSLQLSGDTSSQYVTSVSGSISLDGRADGSVTIGGQPYPFRLVKGTFYLQNPDNSWVTSGPPFDPSQLLDPNKGVATLLSGATGAK